MSALYKRVCVDVKQLNQVFNVDECVTVYYMKRILNSMHEKQKLDMGNFSIKWQVSGTSRWINSCYTHAFCVSDHLVAGFV